MKRFFIIVGALAALLFAAAAQAETIGELQAQIDAAGAHWTAGETSMSHLSFAEASAICTLPLVSVAAPPGSEGTIEPPLKAMPAHLDWRDMNGKDYLTSIKDQGQCGTCQTFASCGAFEANFKIAMSNDFIQPNFSEQQVYACDGAGLIAYTLFGPLIYMEQSGAADQDCDPYQCTANRPPCSGACSDWQARSHRLESYQFLMFPSSDTLMTLLQKGPFIAGFEVYEDFENYTGGVYEHVSGALVGGHAVVVVGYDQAGQYWIAKNSWGTNWGEQGYFRIKWGMCGFVPFGFQSAGLTLSHATMCDNTQAATLSELHLNSTNLAAGEGLGVSFAWESPNANISGSELWYAVDGGTAVRYDTPLVDLAGTSSSGKGAVVYQLTGPFAGGQHTLAVHVKDICGVDSNAVTAKFTVAGGSSGDDDAADDDAADDDAAAPSHSGSSSGGGCGA